MRSPRVGSSASPVSPRPAVCPPLSSPTLRAWQRRRHPRNDTRTGVNTAGFPQGRVHLFCDEFTNYQDSAVGIKAITLLNRLGYEVILPRHVESGRAQLSKGLVRAAQACAIANVEALQDVVTEKAPRHRTDRQPC